MTQELIIQTIISSLLVVQLVGFLLFVLIDKYIDKKRKNILVIIIFAIFSLILQNVLEFLLVEYLPAQYFRIAVAVYGYVIRTVIIVLFMYIVNPIKKYRLSWILVVLNSAIHLTAFFSDICFTINSDNFYVGGPLHSFCFIISLVLMLYLLFLVLREYIKKSKSEIFMPIFLVAIMIASMLLDLFFNEKSQMFDYVTVALCFVSIFFYTWLHIQFFIIHEKKLIENQRVKLMLSQIQPHFVYNSLNAIQAIDGVPEKAQNAIIDFSKFLRENIDTLTSPDVVLFNKELEHVKKYVSLEQLRFGEKVKVVYNINCEDFVLPVLTLQMLVENAIKHGITKKYEGGTVNIISEQTDDNYVITVKDDGVGFDVNKELDGNHIGIKSVKNRLAQFVDGSLSIESQMGKGTTATITIPKTNQKQIKL
ncbi:MAG: histidine kinase [Clostridia bacterium]|nr:histidine kinase [Clostridia bacterium]